MVFCDNLGIILLISGELTKIILELTSNTLLSVSLNLLMDTASSTGVPGESTAPEKFAPWERKT